MGGNANPVVSELLARATSGSTADANATRVDVLARLAESEDATVSLIANQLIGRQMPAGRGSKSLARGGDADVVLERTPTLNDMNASDAYVPTDSQGSPISCEQAESVIHELEELRKRNDDLAHALGACPSCWGDALQCRNCRGRGRPGFSVPERQLFSIFVLPAVRMLRTHEMKTDGVPGRTQPKTAEPGAKPNRSANQNERRDT